MSTFDHWISSPYDDFDTSLEDAVDELAGRIWADDEDVWKVIYDSLTESESFDFDDNTSKEGALAHLLIALRNAYPSLHGLPATDGSQAMDRLREISKLATDIAESIVIAEAATTIKSLI